MKICKLLILIGLFFIGQVLAQPDTLWVRRFDNNGNNDIALDVAVDSFNNIIVMGQSRDTSYAGYHLIVKYNPDGDTIWTSTYPCSPEHNKSGGVVVDGDNNIIITGVLAEVLDGDYVTVKFNSDGDTIWSRRYDGGENDYAYDVTVDNLNNIIATGRSKGNGHWDYLTVKYTPDGDTIWTRRYDSGNSDWAQGVATDSYNNVIVVGVGESIEYGVVKYNSGGDFLWGKEFLGDDAHDVAIDTANNIVVTGVNYGHSDYLTIKYNSGGDTLWRRTYDSGNWGGAWAVAVDKLSNIFVTGESEDEDFLTIKYNPDGNTVWTLTYDSGDSDCASGVCVDEIGNVIVSGTSYNGLDNDYLIVKYESEVGIVENTYIPVIHEHLLIQNSPNPFTNQTQISYHLSLDTDVRISIYNIMGQKVITLIDENRKAGCYSITWNRKNASRNIVPSGIYFCLLKAGNFVSIEKMIILD